MRRWIRMHTATPLTLHLLGAIGLYLVAIGAGALTAADRWQALAGEMERSPGLTVALGLATYAIGVALLGVHHGLADGLLILAVRRGLIACPPRLLARPRGWAIVSALLGLAFILPGIFVPAGPTL